MSPFPAPRIAAFALASLEHTLVIIAAPSATVEGKAAETAPPARPEIVLTTPAPVAATAATAAALDSG